jgi:hypothetical protein
MRLTNWGLVALTAASLAMFSLPAQAELKAGNKLNKANCQEAKDLLPENVMEKFCAGQYEAEIIEVKDADFQYSTKFKSGSEANAGKYFVTENGYLNETATKSWPHFWYGFPFPDLDEKDPQAAYKVMYNHQVARFQIGVRCLCALEHWPSLRPTDRQPG